MSSTVKYGNIAITRELGLGDLYDLGTLRYRLDIHTPDAFGVRAVYLSAYVDDAAQPVTQFFTSNLIPEERIEQQALRQGFGVDRQW